MRQQKYLSPRAMCSIALHKRAVAEGVSEGAIEDAMESAEPKTELIALLMSKLGAAASAEHEEQPGPGGAW